MGDERSDFPHTAYLISGTQASTAFTNRLIVMKMSNMQKTQPKEDSDSEEDSEDEEGEVKPDLECAIIHHQGSVNRVRVCVFKNFFFVSKLITLFQMSVVNDRPLAASWSETGKVHLWDISHPLRAVNDPACMKSYIENKESPRPLFTFNGNYKIISSL